MLPLNHPIGLGLLSVAGKNVIVMGLISMSKVISINPIRKYFNINQLRMKRY